MNLTLLIIGVLLLVSLVLVIAQYIKLNRFKNKVEESWKKIEAQLRRRYDLLPKLTETVKPHLKHEKTVFEKITSTQNHANSASNVIDQAFAENKLSQAIKSVFAMSEDYPKLKTSEAFRNVQQELSDIEDDIRLVQQDYNTIVQENNTIVEKVPSILIAGLLGFGRFDFFEIGHREER
jgi:LemA protein